MQGRDPEHHGITWKPSVTAALRKGQRLVERGGELELSALAEKYQDLVLERYKMYSQENLTMLGF